MKHWIRRSLLGALGASIALGALTACGFHGGRAGWAASTAEERARQHERIIERVTRRLDLDAAQQAKLQVLAGVLAAQRASLAGNDPRQQMQALVAGDKFDRARAQALAQQAAAALSARSPEVIAAFGDFYDSLNPQQQAQVRERMQKRHGWWRRG